MTRMDEIDVINYAKQLKYLLQQHDKAVTQIAVLEMQILDLDSKIFTNSLNGNILMKTNHERRKSTIVGVKIMFEKFKQQRWQAIQKLSSYILQTIQPEGTSQIEPWQTTTNQENNSMIAIETESFCQQFRSI